MWSSEGNSTGGNIYENHSGQPMLVTVFMHNEVAGGIPMVVTVPPAGNDIQISAGQSMAITTLVEDGRAITCAGSGQCRFSIFIHAR